MKRVISIALILCSLKYISVYAQTIGIYSTAQIIHEAEPDEKTIPYNVPLDEIAEKIEYIYAYESMVSHNSESEEQFVYGELGKLPTEKDIIVSVYVANQNKILFLPEDRTNTEILLNDIPCNMYYSEQYKGYCFYALIDWLSSEDGVPVNGFEDGYDNRIVAVTVGEKGEANAVKNNYSYLQVNLDDLVKLGEVAVNFESEGILVLPEITTDGNEYVDAMLKNVKKILRERQAYGTYYIYPETYGRIYNKKGTTTLCKITAALIGEGREEYIKCDIVDNSGISDDVWFVDFPEVVDSSAYFINKRYMETQTDGFISEIMNLQRGAIQIEVSEETPEITEDEYIEDTENIDTPNLNTDIDFRAMSAEEAAGWINYVYSYGEYFSMNELGYQAGELRGYCDEDIIMYTWENTGDTIYFIPASMTNTTITSDSGEKYRVYVNKDGYMEFYYLERNRYADRDTELRTSLFMKSTIGREYINGFITIGEGKLHLQEFELLDMPKVVEDEYVLALEKYIATMLKQEGKSGRYEIYVGEYEALANSKVCLSAACLGEEEAYYFRYMIVKNGEENYYFWPVGFGLNGSLEECAGDRHYMNKVCIERTKQLERSKFVMDIAQSLPETVWEEKITYEEQVYLAAFERISPAFETLSDLYGGYADYQLVVKDENGNVVSSQILTNYPITLEEVYWFKDISGDDFPDVILCSSYVEGNGNRFTDLIFYIWNNEKLIYESKPLPWDRHLDGPVWNEELSSIILAYIDDEVNMEMFTYRDGEWRLSGKCAVESETEKENGNIEFVCGEYFYKDNQTIKNEIKVTVPEQNLPWHDDNSIWGGTHNVQNEWLFPSYAGWKTTDKELEGGETVWKYTRNDHNVIQ